MSQRVLVPLSGGIDSTVVLASLVKSRDYDLRAVTFSYGQPHHLEISYAKQVAEHYRVPWSLVKIPYMPRTNDVVFAGRNLMLAGAAVAIAAAEEFRWVMFGVNQSDWLRFPDCRPEFWSHVKKAALAAYNVRVVTPLLYSDKRSVVEYALALGVPLEMTWSCYAPENGKPCGKCLACDTRNAALLAPDSPEELKACLDQS